MSIKQRIEQLISKVNLTYIVRLLATLLIVVVLIGFLAGIVKTFIDLKLFLDGTIDQGLKQLLINVLTLLAVIEVLRTALSYLKDGRVRVTYIVDTVLIIMLNEVLTFWYSGDHTMVFPLIALLLTLILIRILCIKYSPNI